MSQPARKITADVALAENGGGRSYVFTGAWRHETAEAMAAKLDRLARKDDGIRQFDLSGVTAMDTAGAWIIRRFMTRVAGPSRDDVHFVEGGQRYVELIDALPAELRAPEGGGERLPLFQRIFAPVGEVMVATWDDIVAAMYILGSAVRGAQLKLGRHSGVSPAAIVHQIDRMGVMAVPIITLMSFLIGAIIAQQGAFQLRYFGAEVFVVDLVGILQLREIGVLLTAIMIAGRSGSAITAEIGSMKMREEVDALKVMGLSPVGVLVFPRLVALTVALPLLTIIANFAALVGAALVAWGYSGITIPTFLARLQEAIDFSSVAAGMIKAPFMALIIGVVAAVEGLKVGGSAESLGRHVTSSVVKSIFVVILIDGLFAMFYASIDF
ncbi:MULTISPECIES: ABC transporter permease [unclassified Ensifer]|uniref:ABC transporter permease n=1 Tax=unclassified Ensifer TaxID=2633371 RepID=UPI000813D7E1|nr:MULTISPECIES: ABC transporter permease [unclassified Ensifer]OCP10284.1 organic solvent ABC transporter permease [Ensifer sp. LC13]OCP11276.1 organic solvent ABC transporter permease [Ensifer sp. LC11]OCP14647.1 organic solvent ABC transporter permease [Ensifer sp. LC14]OCP33242.1 organic solvent ABC transporter permease [Ensifer sp. LC499]